RVPADAKIIVLERPVSRLGGELVPGQPPRLVEPEAIGIGTLEIVQFGKLARTDARVEVFGNRMDGFGHVQSLATRSNTRRACTRCGRSTILPPTDSTPASGCASNAATISSAWLTSSADDVKAALMTATCAGWMASLPVKPSRRAASVSRFLPSSSG